MDRFFYKRSGESFTDFFVQRFSNRIIPLILIMIVSTIFAEENVTSVDHFNIKSGEHSEIDYNKSVFKMDSPDDSLIAGKHIMFKSIEFHGGSEYLTKIKDMEVTAIMKITTTKGSVDITNKNIVLFDDDVLLKSDITTPEGRVITTFDGENAGMSTPQGFRVLKGDQREEFMQSIFCNTINLLKGISEGRYTAKFVDFTTIKEHDVFVIKVEDTKGRYALFYIDSNDYALVGKSYRTRSFSGIIRYDEWFESFKRVNNFDFPFSIMVDMNDETYGQTRVKELKINSGIVRQAFNVTE